MTLDTASAALIATISVNGLLGGAALDHSFKQLPARHRIGPVAFGEYIKAADLSNGVPWYAGMALLTVASTVVSLVATFIEGAGPSTQTTVALSLLAAGTLGWMFETSQAAPTLFKVRGADGNEAELARILRRFAFLNVLRCASFLLALGSAGWALAAHLSGS